MHNNIINNLRLTAVNMIEKAKSGHPGIALSTAPLFYTLYANQLNVVPNKPIHFLRDRFVLCAGHSSSVYYATLNAFGFDITSNDLKTFRQLNSKCTGLPNCVTTPGVDCTTGPLGQGIATAVGMAMAEQMMAETFNKTDIELFDNYTYVLAGEGSLMEGVASEALCFAGSLKLNKLIVIFDCNNITIEGNIDGVFEQDTQKVLEGWGFNVLHVNNANDINEINSAIQSAKSSVNKPSFIVLHSTIGYGSFMQGNAKVHGTPLGLKGINQLKQNLGYTGKAFEFTANEKKFLKLISERFKTVNETWERKIKTYKTKYNSEYKKLQNWLNKDYKKLQEYLNDYLLNKDLSLREISGCILNKIANFYENICSGSADVAPSAKSELVGYEYFNTKHKGKNIKYGVREFGMSCVSNGIALYGGIKPCCSTFFVFSDYMKSGIRSSAIMNLPVLYIFSHDSVAVGEDGITHQPVEHLWALREMPDLNVFRPCDFNECKASYVNAFSCKNKPSAIVLCKQKVKNLYSSYEKALKGGYVIKKELKTNIDCILIATGSEVQLAIECANLLEKNNLSVRVVSMPCLNIFDKQTLKYKESVLPKNVKCRAVIELATEGGWHKYVGENGKIFCLKQYGFSGDYNDILNFLNFTPKYICEELYKFIKNFKN